MFVNLGFFLSNKLSPVCSSCLSIFLPPRLCSQLGTGQCLPRRSVKHLGHLATQDMEHQLWTCHLLFLSPTLKSKNATTTPKPSAKYGSNHRSQGNGPPEHSLCVPHLEQAHGSRAIWAPPCKPFPVPVAASALPSRCPRPGSGRPLPLCPARASPCALPGPPPVSCTDLLTRP